MPDRFGFAPRSLTISVPECLIFTRSLFRDLARRGQHELANFCARFGAVGCGGDASSGEFDGLRIGFRGPLDNSANPTMAYGVGDNTSSVVLPLNGATSITISYVDGLVSAFAGAAPSVDALGYVGSNFGSGMGLSGIGSSGTPFPSFFIDPTNTGPDIWLAALIGTFTDSSGVIVGTPFAPGDGPFVVAVPIGATALSLGVNDDIFSDNSGGWDINVAGTGGAAPEPSTWAMMLVGLAGLGLVRYRASRKAAFA